MEDTQDITWKDRLRSILEKLILLMYVITNIKSGDTAWFLACIMICIAFINIKHKENRIGSIAVIALFSIYYLFKKLSIYYMDESIITNSIIVIGIIGVVAERKIKHKLIQGLCILLVVPIVFYTSNYIKKDKIIKDLYLEKNIIQTLDQHNKKISIKDLENIKELSIGKRVRILDGIENLKNLKKLEMDCKNLQDYSELKALKKLETLWIYNVDDEKLNFLKEYKNLKELHISFKNDKSENIILPKHLKKLKITKGVNIHIDYVKTSPYLEELDLSQRQIVDFTPLMELKNLKKLNISDTNINTLDVIKNLYSLEKLDISKSMISYTRDSIKDLTPLMKLEKLNDLDISCNIGVKNIVPLETLMNLHVLNMRECRVDDVSPLKSLKNLEVLHIEDNLNYNQNIKGYTFPKNIGTLNELDNLKELYVDGLDIKNLNGIKNLKQLEILHAERNKIKDITGMKELYSLKNVSFNQNKIEDIDPITHLIHLEKLDLGDNCIEDISPLKKLIHLKELNLNNNKIIDIEPLKNLHELEWIGLDENKVIDYSPLKNLDKIYKDYKNK
ncbi:leucine-rich repeat domain-containing protein [Inediibacterium massiliense]|uniref:leucine-rich repeat domain-containing protein n=1 Tax=Inediibacterium massiliense TaxID=1658111 RepID=UPI0006B51939|nr:leucine-rich repeat domain-containing protein [Inediibacterium massiliense]